MYIRDSAQLEERHNLVEVTLSQICLGASDTPESLSDVDIYFHEVLLQRSHTIFDISHRCMVYLQHLLPEILLLQQLPALSPDSFLQPSYVTFVSDAWCETVSSCEIKH